MKSKRLCTHVTLREPLSDGVWVWLLFVMSQQNLAYHAAWQTTAVPNAVYIVYCRVSFLFLSYFWHHLCTMEFTNLYHVLFAQYPNNNKGKNARAYSA